MECKIMRVKEEDGHKSLIVEKEDGTSFSFDYEEFAFRYLKGTLTAWLEANGLGGYRLTRTLCKRALGMSKKKGHRRWVEVPRKVMAGERRKRSANGAQRSGSGDEAYLKAVLERESSYCSDKMVMSGMERWERAFRRVKGRMPSEAERKEFTALVDEKQKSKV